jgi:hypothetical protein
MITQLINKFNIKILIVGKPIDAFKIVALAINSIK